MNKAESKLVLELRAENAKFKKDMEEANRKLEKFGQTAERQTKRVAQGMREMDVVSRKANHAIGMSANQLNEFGRQSQDVIVQMQQGTSMFTIMAQQGSQLASVFGPSGALIGGVVALAGALGGMLWRSLDAAAAEAEEAREAFEKLIPQTPLAQLDVLNAQIEAGKEKIAELKAAVLDAQVAFDYAPSSTISGSPDAVARLQTKALAEKEEATKQLGYAEEALRKLIQDRADAEAKASGGKTLEENRKYYADLWKLEQEGQEFIDDLVKEALDERAKMEKDAAEQSLKALKQAEQERQKLLQSVEQIRTSGLNDTSKEIELYENNLAILEEFRKQGLDTHQRYNSLVENETKRHNATIYQINAKAIEDKRKQDEDANELIGDMVKDALKAHEEYVKERERILQQYDPASQEEARHKALVEAIRSKNADLMMSDQEANAKMEEEAVRHAAAMNEINITAMQERGEHLAALMETYRVNTENAAAYFENAFAGAAESFKLAVSDAMATALVEGENFKDMMDQIWKTLATKIISAIINMGLEFMAVHLLGQKMQAAALASTVLMGKAAAIAWAPGAAMASLATAGGNAAPAQGGIAATTSMALGLAGMAHDGIANVPREGTWLLDKGERVFSADQNERIIQAVQSVGSSPAAGGGAFDAEAVALLRQIAAKQSIVFNGPGWDARQIFDMLEKLISKEDRVLIRRGSRNAQELAA